MLRKFNHSGPPSASASASNEAKAQRGSTPRPCRRVTSAARSYRSIHTTASLSGATPRRTRSTVAHRSQLHGRRRLPPTMPHGPNPALFMNRRRDAQHRAAVDDANADDTSEVAPQAHASAMDATIAAAHVLSTMRSRRRLGADDAGAGGMGNLAPPVEFAVRREELLRAIARFQARDKYCWTLPVGLLGFTLWCIALIVHANIGAANLVESGYVVPVLRRRACDDGSRFGSRFPPCAHPVAPQAVRHARHRPVRARRRGRRRVRHGVVLHVAHGQRARVRAARRLGCVRRTASATYRTPRRSVRRHALSHPLVPHRAQAP